MAFAVVYKSTRVVNFALGEMMMLVAYTSFAIQSRFTLALAPLIVVTILVSAVVGAAAEILVIRPLQGEPLFTLVMSTIGLAIVIRSIVAMVWGALPQPIDLGTSSTFHNLLGVGLTEAQLAVVAVFLLSCVGMTLFFRLTRTGLFMRATAGDERTAQLIGIDVRRIHAIAWVCSTIISGLAGVLIAMIYNLGPDLYANGLKGFPATILDDMMARYEVPAPKDWGGQAYEADLPGQRYTAKQAEGILEVAFSFSPKLLVSALGTPPRPVIARAHDRGMLVGALAGKVKHALRHKQAGVDIVVAQSYEAGGHTGDIGGMVLTPQVVDAVAPIPVLAAGGIATGRQMAAALALGAQGVWCGSVWLTTGESECSPLVRQKLIDATTEDTLRTRAFTGKPARYLRSAWVDEWESQNAPQILPNPLHSSATDRYIDRIDRAVMSPRARADAGVGMLATKPAGQVIGLINSQSSCRNVVMEMMTGCVDALDGVQERLELK
jgi:NAD(P)H-dependent flavin oxidoreductase YrpB (nitropropane dioxygenase family)/branched-subunit amino acid ABC-type transport system permease component